MTNSSSLVGTAIIGAVVGAAIGFIAGRGPKLDTCHQPGDHNIVVSSVPALDCPEATIYPQNTVSWHSPTGTTLTITFSQVGVFSVNCGSAPSNTCFSGRPTIVWNPGEKQRTLDYSGQLTTGTQNRPLNGRIIIIKP